MCFEELVKVSLKQNQKHHPGGGGEGNASHESYYSVVGVTVVMYQSETVRTLTLLFLMWLK